MNIQIIKGRLTSDVEVKNTTNGTVVSNFGVAVNRRFNKEQADFFDVEAWRQTGEFVSKYFSKGQEILIRGSMQQDRYEDKEGNKRVRWKLVADEVHFCGSKADNRGETANDEADFEEIDEAEDGTLPF